MVLLVYVIDTDAVFQVSSSSSSEGGGDSRLADGTHVSNTAEGRHGQGYTHIQQGNTFFQPKLKQYYIVDMSSGF